jgi:hypothetical protein
MCLLFIERAFFPWLKRPVFVPLTADDVVTPGDNVNVKLDILIDRASVMVVELTNRHGLKPNTVWL